MLCASFPLLYRHISLAKPRRARCEMRDWKAKVRRSTCQAHCPLDAPSFRIRVGYLRRWHFNQADMRIHLPLADISMAAIILFYCPNNNARWTQCRWRCEIMKDAHPRAHSSRHREIFRLMCWLISRFFLVIFEFKYFFIFLELNNKKVPR